MKKRRYPEKTMTKNRSANKKQRTICSNADCKLRKKGCSGFEGCPGYKGK